MDRDAMDRARREPPKGQDSFQPTSQPVLKTIITDPAGAEALVKEAERIRKALVRPLSTSQIRSIFGEVRMIEGEWQTDPQRAYRRLILLKPKMAYRARKETGEGVRDLVSVLSPAVDLVQGDADNFGRFVEFFEAILAYHKAYGGN